MARRRIGQEQFGFAARERGRNAGLDELLAAVDWAALDRVLGGIYAAEKGEPGWPPLALFKALLLGVWHDLSDVRLAEALDDRASFRRFCGFSQGEATPERTAFVRFRRELVRRGLDEKLFRAVVRQLEDRGLVVRTGTLVDATVIRAASKGDGEAGWNVYSGPGPVKGYKAHVATDEAGGIVRKLTVTPANTHDAHGLAPVLGRHPGRVFADTAYDSGALRQGGPPPRRPPVHPAPGQPALAAGGECQQARLECGDRAGPRQDREGLRHRQAQLRAGARPLPRPRTGNLPGPPHLPRLQSQTHRNPAANCARLTPKATQKPEKQLSQAKTRTEGLPAGRSNNPNPQTSQ